MLMECPWSQLCKNLAHCQRIMLVAAFYNCWMLWTTAINRQGKSFHPSHHEYHACCLRLDCGWSASYLIIVMQFKNAAIMTIASLFSICLMSNIFQPHSSISLLSWSSHAARSRYHHYMQLIHISMSARLTELAIMIIINNPDEISYSMYAASMQAVSWLLYRLK